MKIIFDSEKQKEQFMEDLINTSCPHHYGFANGCDPEECQIEDSLDEYICKRCWEKHIGKDIEMEIKESED